jgi:ornithine cyclodeaminase/alanine dehydrogenase-like protein (mu-crystallin family)
MILTRSQVKELLDYDSCISAVEAAFRSDGMIPSGILGSHADHGSFHVKTAGLGRYYAAKINANFPDSTPRIQGVLALFDSTNGNVLALMDSMEITTIRTAAATAVAAKYLARRDSRSLTIVGFGTQGKSHLAALSRIFQFDDVHTCDLNEAYKSADIVVTCTPSTRPILFPGHVMPGTFIAAVGADNEHKQEISPDLLASSVVVADVLEQCATIGDVHHAIDAGSMTRSDVHAELGEIIRGTKPGRTSEDQIIVFDSTGTALEDVAAASIVYERAVARGISHLSLSA